jgi:hypothetical protein
MPSRFETHGPFLLGNALEPLEAKELQLFWADVEAEHAGLQDAIGVYIIAVGSGKTMRPVYVGRAEHGFRARLKAEHAAFRKAGHQYAGEPLSLLLIARVTIKTGRFLRQREKDEHSGSIRDLEVLLIRECLSRDFELVNSAGVKFFRGLVVPGFLHYEGEATPSSRALQRMLRPNQSRQRETN